LSGLNFASKLRLFIFHFLEGSFRIGYLLMKLIFFLIDGCDLILVFNFGVFTVVPSILNLLFKFFSFLLVFSKRSFVIVDKLLRLCDLLLVIILIFLSLFLELLMLFHLFLEFSFFWFRSFKMLLNSYLSFFVSSLFIFLVLLGSLLDMSLLFFFNLQGFFEIISHLFGFFSFFVLSLLKMSFNLSFFFL